MDLQDLQRVDRQTWRRYLFYIDLAILSVFAISLILLIRHTFQAGLLHAKGEFTNASEAMWLVVGDAVFLVASLCWIFYRFFRNQYIVLTRRY